MWRVLTLLALLVPTTVAAKSHSLTIGNLEFNHLSLGVNTFAVNNFTGSNNLGVFPVKKDITFSDAVLTLTKSDGTLLRFDIGSIGPGTDTSVQISDSLLLTSATFTARLRPTKFGRDDDDSSKFVVDQEVHFTLRPTVGNYLIAGLDLGTIEASERLEGCRDRDRKAGEDFRDGAEGESGCDSERSDRRTGNDAARQSHK